MSGGAFNYVQRELGSEMFGYGLSLDYGERGHKDAAKARDRNPMGDRELSELVWDVLCLIHSRDWYISGDIGVDRYLDDVKWFKEKWLPRSSEDIKIAYAEDLRRYYERLIEEMRRLP